MSQSSHSKYDVKIWCQRHGFAIAKKAGVSLHHVIENDCCDTDVWDNFIFPTSLRIRAVGRGVLSPVGCRRLLFQIRGQSDLIMNTMASQITSLTIVNSIIYLGVVGAAPTGDAPTSLPWLINNFIAYYVGQKSFNRYVADRMVPSQKPCSSISLIYISIGM